MSFLYRFALVVTRQQPFLDWATAAGDVSAKELEYLNQDRQTVYLVPESDAEPIPPRLIDSFWEQIFGEELALWDEDEDTWPSDRTREMFDSWFGVTVTGTVVDLSPEEPLTHSEVELGALDYAVHHCAWCDAEIEVDAGRVIGFKLPHRERFADREGLALTVPIQDGSTLTGIMPPADAEPRPEEDLVFRACTSRCEKIIRKEVARALRHLDER